MHRRDFAAIVRSVPTISTFYGVTIRMYWDDHPPPHFHVSYAGEDASVTIETLQVTHGHVPRRALALTLEWAMAHRPLLMENWELCAQNQQPKKLRPLE